MSQRITFYATLVQREKLDEWLEKQKSIGSFMLAIPIVPLVNISSMSSIFYFITFPGSLLGIVSMSFS
jgi:hypothetical protein